jgi:putative peptide zinc metalloprotease protein
VALVASDRPRLRRDLSVVETVLGGEPSLVVADRAAGRYVRFGEGARPALDLLDGTRTAEDLARELGRAAGAEFPVGRARAFIDDLARRGFLEGVPGDPPRRRRGLLAFRLRLFDPDRLAGRLRGLGAVAFSRAGIVSAIALAVAGGTTLAALGPAAAVPRIGDPWTLGAFYVAASLALTAHELGHALALKARGGVVHEAGFLLLFGMPCLYVNVSDAWLLPSRADRIVVSAAGLLVEAALFGAACLALALAPLAGLAAVAVFAVASVCGVRSVLVNLNPLLRLDGYYLLSDALGIPNLRAKAFASLARAVRLLFGRAGPAAGAPARRGERILLPVYGLLAVAWGVLVLGGLLLWSAGWLAARLGAIGLGAWAVVAGALLWRALAGALRLLRGAAAPREPG